MKNKIEKALVDAEIQCGQVNADAYLSGSYKLQVTNYQRTFNRFFDYVSTLSSLSPNAVPDKVKRLVAACMKLLDYDAAMDRFSVNPNQLTDFVKKIYQDIQKLSPTEYILFPAQWTGVKGRYAIIYQFTLDQQGDLLFSIFNTGLGLTSHHRKSSSEKELYSPFLTYKIPAQQIQNAHYFLKILKQLVSIQVPNTYHPDKNGSDFIYKKLLPLLSYVDGQLCEFPVDMLDCMYTAGQLSNSNVQRVLNQLLKFCFTNHDEYRRFMYGYKVHTVDAYIALLREHAQLSDPKLQSLVIQSIRHILRLLNLSSVMDPEAGLFTADEKTRDFAKLTSYLAELRTCRIEPVTAPVTLKSVLMTTLIPLTLPAIVSPASVRSLYSTRPNIKSPLVLSGGANLLNELEVLIAHCDKLTNTGQDQALFEQLEAFFLTIPLPANDMAEPLLPFYSAIADEDNAFYFYLHMNGLQDMYFHCCDRLLTDKVALPRMYLVKLSIFIATAHVNHANKMTGTALSYASLVAGLLSEIAKTSVVDVYLANHNPVMDARLNGIQKLFKNDRLYFPGGVNSTKLYEYYQSLIATQPHLRDELNSRYDKEYGSDETELHVVLRKCNFTAVFYLFKHLETLKKECLFEPLLTKLSIQTAIEALYSKYLGRLHDGSAPQQKQHFELRPFSYDSSLIFSTPLTRNILSNRGFGISPLLQRSIYPVVDNSVAYALQDNHKGSYYGTPRTSNHTQLLPGVLAQTTSFANEGYQLTSEQKKRLVGRVIQPDDLGERKLFDLRRVAQSQIVSTLEYFLLHLEKLEQPEMQVYVIANLFQPGLLINQLLNDQGQLFFELFDSFVREGLSFYQKKGKLTSTSVFFIHLNYLVNQYAIKLDAATFNERYAHYLKQLDEYIHTTPDKSIKAHLHYLRFMALTDYLKFFGLEETLFSNALISYYYIQAYANLFINMDTHSLFQIQYAKYEFQRLLTNHTLQLETVLPQVLRELGVPSDTNKFSVRGAYPICELLDDSGKVKYTTNIERGLLFKEDLAFCATPIIMLRHPLVIQFGLGDTYLSNMSANGAITYINNGSKVLRFIKDGEHFHIQYHFNGHWYQLAPLSAAQANWLQLPHTDILKSSFNSSINEFTTLAWVRGDKTEVMLTKDNQVWYLGARFDTSNWNFRCESDGSSLCNSDNPLAQQFSSIEGEEFVSVHLNQDVFNIRLSRYKLSFTAPKNENRIYFDWDGTRYLVNKDAASLGTGILSLTLESPDTTLCILPIQPFYNAYVRQNTGFYYDSQQDALNVLPKIRVNNELGEDTPQLWQHSDTQSYFILKMKHGKPVPQTPAEAVYLAYLYLGSNQPEKAWEILDWCEKRLGGLTGAYDELRFISWICRDKFVLLLKENESATVSNPPFVACKLKALALVVSVPPHKRVITPLTHYAPGPVNRIVQKQEGDNVLNFYQLLNRYIHTYYSRMQTLRREMPAGFQLSDEECERLLACLSHRDGEPQALGALGFERVRLHLATLRKEWTTLAVTERETGLNAYEQERKVAIQEFIRHHEGVAQHHSKLEYRPINLEISIRPEYIRRIFWQVKESAWDYLPRHQTVSSEFAPLMDEKTFLSNFPTYLRIALDRDDRLRDHLMHFCRATLIASQYSPLDERHPDNVHLLCNILYRFLCSTKSVSEFQHITDFGLLVCEALNLVPEPIVIPQLVDDTSELLVSAEALWDSLPEQSVKISPWLNKDTLPNLNAQPLFAKDTPKLMGLLEQWHAVYARFNSGHAGELKLQALGDMRALAKNILSQPEDLAEFYQAASTEITRIIDVQKRLSEHLLALANKGPQDPQLVQSMQIDIESGKRAPLTLERLLALYLHEDQLRYSLETGLSAVEIDELHAGLTNYLAQGIRGQQLQRVKNQLDNLTQEEAFEAKEHSVFVLAEMLFAKNQASIINEPALTVFQYLENILLKPEQKDTLSRLLATSTDGQYSGIVEQMNMGGGKTKVLLPMLAYLKATGSNLTIIEVPPSLLRTNFVDLKASSLKIFNQNAYVFEFNREQDCTPAQLEELYTHLSEVMVNKGYLVTTGDALQSLELKYLEILSQRFNSELKDKKVYAKWEQQASWLNKLVSLFRNKGDLIIDEVHQSLLLKHKLNYSLGEAEVADRGTLNSVIKLYQFFKYVPLKTEHGKLITLNEVLKCNKLFIHPEQWKQASESLAKQLVGHEHSPLRSYIDQWMVLYGPEVASQIEGYFLNQGNAVPECIQRTALEIKDLFALYKAEVSQLLPFTLKRNQGEHYGPSQRTNLNPDAREVARPYSANNTPKEQSLFGNYIETINYTIQSLLIIGVSKELFLHFMENLLTQGFKEQHEKKNSSIDQTATAHLFKYLVGDASFELGQIDLKNEEQLKALYTHLAKNERLIYEVLKANVLPHIRVNPQILHSDAYNHVELVRSCQGLTGTPFNHTTYHSRLHADMERIKGADGYVIAGIKAKKPNIRTLDFTGTQSFIEQLFAVSDNTTHFRAIVDVAATFKGISNLEVARGLAGYLYQHPEQQIKYLIYFNTDNQLSALRVLPEPEFSKQTPIILGSSDRTVIKERLGCGPEACFTFYDQAHAIGSDIPQALNAKAWVMVDPDTQLYAFSQGAMRMRGLLEGNQSIEVVTPEALASLSFDNLVQLMDRNEKEHIKKDNFEAALLQMNNVLRTHLLTHILLINGEAAVAKKALFFQVLKEFFVETKLAHMFVQYGGLSEEKSTVDILNMHKEQLMRDWERLMGTVEREVSVETRNQVLQELNQIITNASKPDMCHSSQLIGQQLGCETEVQQQVAVQVVVEREEEQTKFDALLQESKYVSWFNSLFNASHYKPKVMQLKSLCESTNSDIVPDFDPGLMASVNYYQSYQGQESVIGMYLKATTTLLFYFNKGKLSCTILSQQECSEWCNAIRAMEVTGTYWIGTTQHAVIAGSRPKHVLKDKKYQLLIEQARYWAGELNLLAQNPQFSWLSNKALDFFEKYLLPCRETLPEHVNQLRACMVDDRRILKFIANNPLENRSHFDWSSRFSDFDPKDAEKYTLLSNAFNLAAEKWFSDDLTQIPWQEKFYLSLSAMGFLMQYIQRYQILKTMALTVELWKRNTGEHSLVKMLEKNILQRHSLQPIIQEFPELEGVLNVRANAEDIAWQNCIVLTRLINELSVLQSVTKKANKQPMLEYFIELRNNEILQILSRATQYEGSIDPSIFWALLGNEIGFTQIQDKVINASESPTEAEFLHAAQHGQGGNLALVYVLTRAVHDSSLQTLLTSAPRQIDEAVLLAIVNSKAASEETLRLVAERKNLSEQVLAGIARHQQTGKSALREVAVKSSSNDTLLLVLKHRNVEQTDDGLFLAITCNNAVAEDTFLRIGEVGRFSASLMRLMLTTPDHELSHDRLKQATLQNLFITGEPFVVDHKLLDHCSEQTIECLSEQPDPDGKTLLNIITYPRTSVLSLLAVTEQIIRDTLLKALLEGCNAGKLTGEILSLILRNPVISTETLELVCQRTDLTEEHLRIIVNHPKAGASSLLTAAMNTKQDTVLSELLNGCNVEKLDYATHLVIIFNPAASNETLTTLSKKKDLPFDSVLRIAYRLHGPKFDESVIKLKKYIVDSQYSEQDSFITGIKAAKNKYLEADILATNHQQFITDFTQLVGREQKYLKQNPDQYPGIKPFLEELYTNYSQLTATPGSTKIRHYPGRFFSEEKSEQTTTEQPENTKGI